ncbi:SAV_6107 family HEPN domain-containing protein [Corynebacterium sp.]|uniref:SAV_6107 family HEPN domain-containing protein n=1 Tax=Corynebacterium sp. TaxID=1720 RepID=UPI0026DB5357|nr:SAV_6107 family HEPN domain-containing protein [Corynebacterium sp.]MDO4609114.1 SAV_6107 family HEPN domain-containing protein [Corynebacterium sp.]
MVIDFERGAAAVVAPAGVAGGALGYLERASDLLRDARGTAPEDAMELIYQAALRIAGAVLEQNPGRRRSADHGAWARVRRHAPGYAGHADAIGAYSRRRERVRLGLDDAPAPEEVAELRALVEDFRDHVESDLGVLPAAA